MMDESPARKLAGEIQKLFQHSEPGGALAPFESRSAFEKEIESLPLDERELALELANYADLLKFFSDQKLKTGSDIADAMLGAAKLPLPERTARIREINRTLMERLQDAGQTTPFRM